MLQKLSLVENILRNFGIGMALYDESMVGLERYDNGLRAKIFQDFDFKDVGNFLRSMESGYLYFTEDQYSCRHCFFRFAPMGGGGGGFCSVGPWIE
jgi:hypothetical protein